MYNNRRDETQLEMRKKEKLNSQRDFKIHSNGVSPNPSGIRAKKVNRDAILDNEPNSRKGLYKNHAHLRKAPDGRIDNSNVERHSYNHPDIRRNISERSDRSDFKKNQANSYLSNKNNRNTVNSGAKAKIKQMLGNFSIILS